MNLGDKVLFVPGVEHALHYNPVTREYPWKMGVKAPKRVDRGYRAGPKPGDESEWEVRELSARELANHIRFIQRCPNPEEAKKNLILIGPCQAWPAVVRGVNDDGTVDLDVQSNQGGVTLHYDKVPVDPSGKAPHSCHEGGVK